MIRREVEDGVLAEPVPENGVLVDGESVTPNNGGKKTCRPC